MNCTSPPELEDRQLLAHLDGEAGQQVAEHLAHCPYCRERAGALAGQQNRLKARLYRQSCPSSIELGDYQLGFLDTGQAASVAAHLLECPHCTRELAQLRSYLRELAPPATTGPLEGVKVLVARLLGEKGGRRSPGEIGLAPAYAMLRGDAPGPITLEANGILILLDVQPGEEGQAAVLGQVAADEQDRWTGAAVELRQASGPPLTTAVDDLGAFRFETVHPGPAELRFTPQSGPAVLAQVEIIV